MEDNWEETDEDCPCCKEGVLLKSPWWDDLPRYGGEIIGTKYQCNECEYEKEE